MRRSLPIDAFICVCLSLLIAWGTGSVAKRLAEKSYDQAVAERAPEENEVGGIAGPDVFRAETLADMLSHDTFTIERDDHDFHNDGAGYHLIDGMMWPLVVLTLPSGERVAARLNSQNTQHIGADPLYGGGDIILPVGRIVYEDLSSDDAFLAQIEHGGPLDRHDLYVDMVGGAVLADREETTGIPRMIVQLLTIAVCYPIFHALGAKLGIWGAYFRRKHKAEWD